MTNESPGFDPDLGLLSRMPQGSPITPSVLEIWLYLPPSLRGKLCTIFVPSLLTVSCGTGSSLCTKNRREIERCIGFVNESGPEADNASGR